MSRFEDPKRAGEDGIQVSRAVKSAFTEAQACHCRFLSVSTGCITWKAK